MCLRHQASTLSTLLLTSALVVVTAACDGQDGAFVGSAVSLAAPSGFFTTSLVPSTLPVQPLPLPGLPLPACPHATPFVSQFALVIAPGIDDLFLHEIGFQFRDPFGRASPLFFSDGDLTTLFGSTLIIGGRHRTFPFDARFGCGLSAAPDSVAISLLLRDKRGGMHRMRLDARVG
jgi:hypothetical protein